MGNFSGTWEEFFEIFRHKKLIYGDWLDHLKSYHPIWGQENVHVVYYEDSVDDLKGTVEKLATFMGKNLSDDVLNTIAKEASFAAMKDRPLKKKDHGNNDLSKKETLPPPGFFNTGTYGKWRELFTDLQNYYIVENYDKELEKMSIKFKN